jgi:glycogen debranching enzyme
MRSDERQIRLYFDDQFAVCAPDLQMSRHQGEGYVVADTRLASGYRIRIGGVEPNLLGTERTAPHAARFEFTNPALDATSGSVEANTVHLRVDRSLGHGVHDDYDLTNFGADTIEVVLEISVECDFADVFDMKDHRLVRRGSLQTTWTEETSTLTSRYRNESFTRALELVVDRNDAAPEYANGGISFRVRLSPFESWHTCLLWIPEIDGEAPKHPARLCHDLLGTDTIADQARREWVDGTSSFSTSDTSVDQTIARSVQDLASLRLHIFDDLARGSEPDTDRDDSSDGIDTDVWVPAAGVPWYVTLFGRDSLLVSLQTPALSGRFAEGTLRALASQQATSYDPERDMEPGKIIHEIRRGELAQLHLIPHTPYYGTHDATTLFVLAAANAWRWHGRRDQLDALRPAVEAALAWIDRDGDRDDDGLQEYGTRAQHGGYFNQGWKDSGDAIVREDGGLPSLPIALCELQGYVVAAKRAWAGVLDDAYREGTAAQQLRDDADRLAEQIETKFWWEDEGSYYLGLDGNKQPIRSVASNPGHLLWSKAIVPERAERVARRLLAADMWSGWGIRTLSSAHVSYNPLSYQLGSVWPHDNACIVEGLRAYGFDGEAAQVARGLFDAAQHFYDARLPELFGGFDRDPGAVPVPYLDANAPQAWAAGAVVQLVCSLLGFDAHALSRTLTLRPCLPDWLDMVRVRNLHVGAATVDLAVRRTTSGHHIDIEQLHGHLECSLR